MLSIAHATTGALIASKIPNPLISIPLVLLSHFLEDRVPHWDVGQGMGKKTKSKKRAFLEELLIDFPLSILLVYLFFQVGKPFNVSAWLGWFFGLLPDFLDFPANFLGTSIAPLRFLSKGHEFFHRSTPNIFWGVLPQVIVIIAVYLLR